ncbi:uncharacterized protein LOC126736565 [Anthonomus grandis grandis]|uniref:uncharacterized protein LOC126736565 n=1 Tax=Anthonomus grandis grandis TaxID=2921223 RepID=UPI002166BA68|nr:uncharacterized protein LOC126736565 [Anthonomus grandis grandis]
MNLHVFYIQIGFMLFLLSPTLTKSLPIVSRDTDLETYSDLENSFKSNELEAIHASNTRSAGKHRKEANHGKQHREARQSDDQPLNYLNKQCAVMYKNGEPVGILQPYKDKYQLLPVDKEDVIPVEISLMEAAGINLGPQKRETKQTSESEVKTANLAAYADERYPYIFAKFKIDSRVEKGNNRMLKNMQKRDLKPKKSPLFSEKDSNSLRSSLSKFETDSEGAESALRDVLSDLGLIDEPTVNKRSADTEKDNAGPEANKNSLIEIVNNDQLQAKSKKKRTAPKYKRPTYSAPKGMSDDEYYDKYIDAHPEIFEQNRESNNNEHHEKKREHHSQENEERHSEVKSEEEKSIVVKKRSSSEDAESTNQKSSEELEERVANQINSKLQSIKEQVRNEIEMLNREKEEYIEEPEDSEDEEEKDKSQRKKRNIMVSLLDQETDDLDPVLAENNLEPHIRRRRSLTKEYFDIDDEKSIQELNDDTSKIINYLDKDNDYIDPLAEENPSSASSRNINSDDNTLIIDLMDQSTVINRNGEELGARGFNSIKMEEDRNSKGIVTTDLNQLQQCLTTSEPPFHIRNLKAFDYDNPSLNQHSDAKRSIKQTRSNSCKCIGQKGCKCRPHLRHPKPEKIDLLTDDGNPVIYLDDNLVEIPRSDTLGYVKERISQSNHKNVEKEEIKRHVRQSGNVRDVLQDGGYTLDLEPDIYRITGAQDQTRHKRDNFFDLVAIHGGGPAMDHLVAVRERSMFSPRIRRKRSSDFLTLKEMKDEELFGALPQSYQGELARVKRIRKR